MNALKRSLTSVTISFLLPRKKALWMLCVMITGGLILGPTDVYLASMMNDASRQTLELASKLEREDSQNFTDQKSADIIFIQDTALKLTDGRVMQLLASLKPRYSPFRQYQKAIDVLRMSSTNEHESSNQIRQASVILATIGKD